VSVIASSDLIRRPITLRNPFSIETLPLLGRLHRAAFRVRRRLSKRFVGRPAKRLFRLMLRLGLGGTGTARLELARGPRHFAFDTRNTQFGALYLPQDLPLYESETSALLDALVENDEVFFDVGANWGWYSLLLASRPGFTGQIHAFEPFPATFLDLAGAVEQTGLASTITCHEVALAAAAGEAMMAFSDGVQSGLARLGEAGGVKVRLDRLDALDLPAPAVIKIDAEDHELGVLRGSEGVIAAARPFIVFESLLHRDSPGLTLDPFTLLEQHGYRFFYPGWVAGHSDCILLKLPADRTVLAVVPLLAGQRFLLPDQLNVLAVPAERMDELRRRLVS
jgi:FkbM family methyltransferase